MTQKDQSMEIQKEMIACRDGSIQYIELPISYDALTVVINPKNTWAETMTVADLMILWRQGDQMSPKMRDLFDSGAIWNTMFKNEFGHAPTAEERELMPIPVIRLSTMRLVTAIFPSDPKKANTDMNLMFVRKNSRLSLGFMEIEMLNDDYIIRIEIIFAILDWTNSEMMKLAHFIQQMGKRGFFEGSGSIYPQETGFSWEIYAVFDDNFKRNYTFFIYYALAAKYRPDYEYQRDILLAGCVQCGAPEPTMLCGGCGKARYCGRDCQKEHWALHQDECQ